MLDKRLLIVLLAGITHFAGCVNEPPTPAADAENDGTVMTTPTPSTREAEPDVNNSEELVQPEEGEVIEEPPCPSEETLAVVMVEFEAFYPRFNNITGMTSNTLAMRAEGTLGGVVVNMLWIVDPASRQLHIKYVEAGETTEVKVSGANYSVFDETGWVYGRDLGPRGAYHWLIEAMEDNASDTFFDDDVSGVSFGPEGGDDFSDIEASCTTFGDKNAFEITFNESTGSGKVITDAVAPYRVQYLEFVDPATQTNARYYFSYDQPDVTPGTKGTRLPFTWVYDYLDFSETANGRWRDSYLLVEETEWVPVKDIQVVFTDEAGELVGWGDLAEGAWEINGGTYEYRDRDANGLLSAGDTLIFETNPDLSLYLYDKWAEDYASSQEKSA